MRIKRVGIEKRLRMLRGIERLESAKTAVHHLAGRKGRLLPIDDDFAERLMRDFGHGGDCSRVSSRIRRMTQDFPFS
jgi:hypothetical protein